MMIRYESSRFRTDLMALDWPTCAKSKKTYLDLPAAFDIESSSLCDGDRKFATMYIWMFGIRSGDRDLIVYGRTWDEFMTLIDDLVDVMGLREDRMLTVYVHNLAFEFQWFRKRFTWKRIFAMSERRPLCAETDRGIVFRCSYLLTGESLDSVGKHLRRHQTRKKSGDLDYNLIRHSGTPLSDTELGYCENDIVVLLDDIQERIEDENGITGIPLTKTGYVRRYCRDKCLYAGASHKRNMQYVRYRKNVAGLTMTPEEYKMAHDAFAGGYTHASAWWADRTLENVGSGDIASSYPSVMVSEMRFPMSKGIKTRIVNRQQFDAYLRDCCCIFTVEFIGIESSIEYEHYISSSKCHSLSHAEIDNGRVVSAERLTMTITEIDYAIIKKTYTWCKMRVGTMYRYSRGYLPTDFVSAILDLYHDKTAYKNVPDKAEEYATAKSNLNSLYGMCATAVCRDKIVYKDGQWLPPEPANIVVEIAKYNRKPDRFLSYLWGVYVTALARANIWRLIIEFGEKDDYVYCDTDSVKGLHFDDHRPGIDAYNALIQKKMALAARHHGIDLDRFMPADPAGVRHMMGIFEFEGIYDRFKTLGAKRYARTQNGEYKITVSGVNSKYASPWIVQTFPDPFRAFSDDLIIPPDHTGKMTHTYIDDPVTASVTDYRGVTMTCHELSSVHLEKASYEMTLSSVYADYLAGVREYEK